jgi:hypothetical protein
MPDMIIQYFKFPCTVGYIKPHGKIERTAFVAGRDALHIQRAALSEAPAAFKITRHTDLVLKDPIVIRRFQGGLWWPLVDQLGLLRFSKFSNGLESGDGKFLRWLVPGFIAGADHRPSEDGLRARAILRSTHGEMVAQAQRGSVQLLLCDDIVYMIGDEPTYSCDLGYVGEQLVAKIKVVDPRRLHEGSDSSPTNLGSYKRHQFDRIALDGGIFCADEQRRADEFCATHGATPFYEATVEIVTGEKLRMNPIKFQIAAAVRELTHRLVEFEYYCGGCPIFHGLKALVNSDDIAIEDAAKLLLSYISWCEQEGKFLRLNEFHRRHWEFAANAIERIKIECAQRGVKSPFFNDDDDEDTAAIASLA